MVNGQQRALTRRRRELRHDMRSVGSRANGLRTEAKGTAEQVLNLI
jgi:hypothetical protein